MKLRTAALAFPLVIACTAPSTPRAATTPVAVVPQYDTTHVYVAPEDVDAFVVAFLGTFGGHSTKQVVATVTPTPSRTTSQLLQTPFGTVSLFGFQTPIPFPFGAERNGYLVTDLDAAVTAARSAGASVLVEPFADPIGRDAIVQWPGGVNMQLYWHTTPPSYAPLETIPENRVYLATDRADAFTHAFLAFAHGTITSDTRNAPGSDIGRPAETYRRIRIDSPFGKLLAFVTDGHLPYPHGAETTGYEVPDLPAILARARAHNVTILEETRRAAFVKFPGGYIAEVHPHP